ncbi:hypothetical protein MASR2M50_06890 [Thauera sp.]
MRTSDLQKENAAAPREGAAAEGMPPGRRRRATVRDGLCPGLRAATYAGADTHYPRRQCSGCGATRAEPPFSPFRRRHPHAPFTVQIMERPPRASQAFVPMSGRP